jgi:hypothetical protein
VFNPGNNTKNADLNPEKYPSMAKNPPKYTTAYIVQQRNCRWHCEPTYFLGWASTMIIYIHTLPLKSLHLLSLPLQSLPLQTLRLVFFWPVRLFKHKEYLSQRTAKERDKKYRGFTFCTATAILHCTFYPALLLSAGYCEKRPDCIT